MNELPELTVAVEVGIPVGELVIATVGGSVEVDVLTGVSVLVDVCVAVDGGEGVLVDVSVIPVVGVNEGEAVADGRCASCGGCIGDHGSRC